VRCARTAVLLTFFATRLPLFAFEALHQVPGRRCVRPAAGPGRGRRAVPAAPTQGESSAVTFGDSPGVSGESWPGGESSGDWLGESADSPPGDVGSSGVSSTGPVVPVSVGTVPHGSPGSPPI